MLGRPASVRAPALVAIGGRAVGHFLAPWHFRIIKAYKKKTLGKKRKNGGFVHTHPHSLREFSPRFLVFFLTESLIGYLPLKMCKAGNVML